MTISLARRSIHSSSSRSLFVTHGLDEDEDHVVDNFHLNRAYLFTNEDDPIFLSRRKL